MRIPFSKEHTPLIGEVEWLRDDIRVVTAPNAGPMTFTGTRSYIVGRGEVAVIDPGPVSDAHLGALLSALEGETVAGILVTHAHLDHSPLAGLLSNRTGAPVYAAALEPPRHTGLEGLGGGEGIDRHFSPDVVLCDGDSLPLGGLEISVVATPGHLSDHLAFGYGDALFSGDHVMGWASTMISPPEGSLTAFMTSLDVLEARCDRVYFPGHGAPVTEPLEMVRYLRNHRKEREAQIRDLLGAGPEAIDHITATLYKEVDRKLHGAASRNVLAHILDLLERDLVEADGPDLRAAHYALK